MIDGRFEIGPVIGRGAMGVVHAARDLRLGREVAVKLLRPDLAADDAVRSRFEDEARSAAQLSHHAIVTVFDSGEWEGTPYLVMERLPGRTLADEMADGPLPESRVREVAMEIGGALDAAHRFGVIHRDVKPANILLTEAGRVKLADFGIAKSAEGLDHTVAGTVVGTPAYLAPERLSGLPATQLSDLYALGVVLYEALSGEKPFGGDTPMAVAMSIHASQPTPIRERRPDLDGTMAEVIDRAMSRDPQDRPQSAAALVDQLASPPAQDATVASPRHDAGTAVLPVVADARPAAMPQATSWWHARQPHERQAIIVAIVLVLGLSSFMVLRDGSRSDPSPPPTPVVSSPLPEPLDDAIVELEDSVQP
ncbi:MAG TPA: serine/threonine-protein kinase [Acidimicrobiales bacterium]|nr:serine/threonine-protein kinase [Acidimicrobiales bacterium]